MNPLLIGLLVESTSAVIALALMTTGQGTTQALALLGYTIAWFGIGVGLAAYWHERELERMTQQLRRVLSSALLKTNLSSNNN